MLPPGYTPTIPSEMNDGPRGLGKTEFIGLGYHWLTFSGGAWQSSKTRE